MARRFKRKIKWKNIISYFLVGVLLVGALAGLAAFLGKDTKTIPSSVFAVGSIDDDGNYVKSKLSIYTKDLIECDGLTIEPDFKATGKFQVFFYDSEKDFVEATDVMDSIDGVYKIGDIDMGITYCRIVITPDVPLDDNGKEVKDFKIRFFEVVSYANDYKITVNKKQELYGLTEFDEATQETGKTYSFDDNDMIVKEAAANTVTTYARFDVSDFSTLALLMNASGGVGSGEILFTDASGKEIDTISYSTDDGEHFGEVQVLIDDISVPKGASYCYIVGSSLITSMVVYGK